MSHSVDGRWSQIVGRGMGVGRHPIFNRQEPSLERSIGGPLLQAGHHLRRTFYHRSLDGSTQFPPTIGQPKGLAAGDWRRHAEIRRKVRLGVQLSRSLDVVPQSRGWRRGA